MKISLFIVVAFGLTLCTLSATTVMFEISGTVDNVLGGQNAQQISGTDTWLFRLQYEDTIPRIQGPMPGFIGFIGTGPSLISVKQLARGGSEFGFGVDYNGPGIPGQGIGLGVGAIAGEDPGMEPFIYFSASTSVIIFNDQKLPSSLAEWDFRNTTLFTLRAQLGSGVNQFNFESHTLERVSYTIIPEPLTCALLSGLVAFMFPRRRPSGAKIGPYQPV